MHFFLSKNCNAFIKSCHKNIETGRRGRYGIVTGLEFTRLLFYCYLISCYLNNFMEFFKILQVLIILGPNFPTLLKDFILEISAMHTLNNRYLLPLYGVVLSNPIKIISQLAPDGNLISKLRKRKLHSLIRFIVHKIFLDF